MIIHITDAKPLTEEEIYRLAEADNLDVSFDRSGSIPDEMIGELTEEIRKVFDQNKRT